MSTEVKTFDSPDETRPFEGKGQAKVVQLAGHAVAEGTFEPGWKWSRTSSPLPGPTLARLLISATCFPAACAYYMDDGSETEIKAGDVVAIPPGHDAEVSGPEACVMVDFGEIGDYAKRS